MKWWAGRGNGSVGLEGLVYGGSMQDFKKLRVWHLAHDVSLKVVEVLPPRATRKVPGLRGQAIRAATSVSANIAEGCSRATRAEFLRFVEIALGSQNELDTHLLLAREAGVLAPDVHARLQRDTTMVRRMLLALMRTLQRRIAEDESARPNAPSTPSRPFNAVDSVTPLTR
jgi:four helix bundle protein